MKAGDALRVLEEAAAAIVDVLDDHDDWSLSGLRDTQYNHDLVADAAGLKVLHEAGFGVMSEESGITGEATSGITVVLDPIDGSSNASRGIPWWAVSMCAIDNAGPLASLVMNVPTSQTYRALRGEGATVDGRPCVPRPLTDPDDVYLVGVVGWPSKQFARAHLRSLGSAALELCSVASGMLDGFIDCTRAGCAPWDYLGAFHVCQEAGVKVTEAFDREIVLTDMQARRSLVAAPSEEVLRAAKEFRQGLGQNHPGG